MKKKLQLNQLKVNSFMTQIAGLKGGTGTHTDACVSAQCEKTRSNCNFCDDQAQIQ